jgi:uncharacterized protein YuzE
MKAVYNADTDTLTLELRPGPVAESDEDKPGVIPDYDQDGNLSSVEVLDASTRVHEARSMLFEVSGTDRAGG